MIKTLAQADITRDILEPIFMEVDAAVPLTEGADRTDIDWIVQEWTGLMRAGIAETWAAEVGGRIVGLLGAIFVREFFTGQPMGQEVFWFVLKEHRGTGVARELFQAFEAECRRRQVKTIWAGTNKYNEAERLGRVYERDGFVRWGEVYRKLV